MTDIISKPLAPEEARGVELAYERILGKVGEVNVDLAKKVHEKLEEDRQAFADAAREATPSNEPKYWAKKGCRKCYGRGIIGKKHVFSRGTSAISIVDPSTGEKIYANARGKEDIPCSCTQKNYQKWLAVFRMKYNAERAVRAALEGMNNEEQSSEGAAEETPSADTATENQEAV